MDGKVAVVTGAGRGIGAAVAKKLAKMGATSVLCGRTHADLEALAKEIRSNGGEAESIVCDVAELGSVEAAVERIQQNFGRVDVLVNNAGVGGPSGPLHELSEEGWSRIVDTNLRGVFHCIRSFAPLMIASKGGDIVNISSIAGKNPLPNGAAYAASKWGLNGLTFSVAEELRGYGIRVSLVSPGSTNTEFSPHSGKAAEKMLQPEDIGEAVAMIVTQPRRTFVSEVVMRPTQKP